MSPRNKVNKGYWVGSAACCFFLATLMILTVLASRPRLSALLTTAAFITIFLTSAILYLVRWRPVLRATMFVIGGFYVLVVAQWLRTGDIIGPLPLGISVLLIWQTGKLQKTQPVASPNGGPTEPPGNSGVSGGPGR